MPIKRKEFEAGNFKRIRYNRKDHPIAVLLKKEKGSAFNVEEISKRVKMNKSSVRSMLSCLKKDNLILHKSPYFAWKKK